MLLAKSFFGFEPTSFTDYLLVYGVCAAIIVLGLLVLKWLKKKEQPSSPSSMVKRSKKVLERMKKVEEELTRKKLRSMELNKDVRRAQFSMENLAYACTVIIDANHDISYEGVRSSLQNAIVHLDNVLLYSRDVNHRKDCFNQAKSLVESAQKTLADIYERSKNFNL